MRRSLPQPHILHIQFQFTHPGRGATIRSCFPPSPRRGFNSRTPGGVRPSPRELSAECLEFQFTHPGRGATSLGLISPILNSSFNSRTPGGVRRRQACLSLLRRRRFNSRTPGGVRPHTTYTDLDRYWFQFTHPGRGATVQGGDRNIDPAFQFTHPGRGATYSARRSTTSCRSFNSRTPGGVRQPFGLIFNRSKYVSIHAPREGCDSPSAFHRGVR